MASNCLAQDATGSSRTAEAIIVSGHGLEDGPATPAYDIGEIGPRKIGSSASGRIEDVLSSVAGFQQFRRADSRATNPSNQGVTLRALGGNASSRALVLLDGVPVANPFFGYIPLSAISPDRLSAIRITRGGGSGAFGAGAVSGTIELTSAGPDTHGLLTGQALVDQRGETQSSLTLAPRVGSGFVVASAAWDCGKGFWTTPESQRVPASARARFDSWSGSLRAVAPLGDEVEVQASALTYDDARTFRFEGADSTSSGSQASLRLVGRGEWQFDVLAYAQTQNYSNVVISSRSFRKTLDQIKTPATGIGGKIELRPPVGKAHVLRIGSDLRLAEGTMSEAPYSTVTGRPTAFRRAGGRNSDLGLYVEDDWTLGNLVLTGGARADRWTVRDGFYREIADDGSVTIDNTFDNRSGWETNLRAGAVWRPADAIALRAAAYTGFRQPTLNELYRPFVVFPVTTRANADLRNEKLEGFEAGADITPSDWLTLSFTAFDNRLKDAIANATIGTDLRQRQNVSAIEARGVELSTSIAWNTLSFDGSLAWTNSKVDAPGQAMDGLRPAQVPKLMASGTLAWSPAPRWRFAATLRHVGSQFEDDLESYVLPSATTVDAYFSAPVAGPVSLILRGENLAGEEIVTRNQDGEIDLGTPRTVWIGVKVDLGR